MNSGRESAIHCMNSWDEEEEEEEEEEEGVRKADLRWF
jgi:hypothetical protein